MVFGLPKKLSKVLTAAIKLFKNSYIVPIFHMIWIAFQDESHDILLVGHDRLVQGRMAIMVPGIGPAFFVQELPNGSGITPDDLLMNGVNFLLKRSFLSFPRFEIRGDVSHFDRLQLLPTIVAAMALC